MDSFNPSSLISIDPGITTGWARFWCGSLVDCGILDGKQPEALWPIMCGAPQAAVIEKPNYRKDSNERVSPNDLITLGMTAGGFAGVLRLAGCRRIDTPLPMAWKGSVSKKLHNAQVLRALSEAERMLAVTKARSYPESAHNNMIDAIGLGKWWLRKEGAYASG